MIARVYELTAPRTLELREVPLDVTPLGDGEILAATEYTAVSPGTELAAWSGKPPLRPSRVYPRLVGYCNVARVLAVGASVRGIAPGDHVVTHQSHRSHFRCPADDALLVLRGLAPDSLRRLAATYLYHLGYVSLFAGGYVPGHVVAVVGVGTLGLATAALVAAFGGEPLALSGRAGTDGAPAARGVHVLPKSAEAVAAVPAVAALGGADIVVNTSDAWADHLLALRVARKGGTVVLLGFPGRGEPAADFNPLDSQYVYDKQLTLRQAGHVTEIAAAPIDARFTLKRNMRYLADLIERGVLDAAALLGVSAGWQELGAVYERLARRDGHAYSAVLEWNR